ncbi:MAG TPA: BRCT domain-containing protein [Longimicrobiales bacterium]|nr:BRCT domain-containing protein [Longimicrobiales bacterium]
MPRSSSMRAHRAKQESRITQGLAEMVGVVRGVIADGVVSVDEATQLVRWTRDNPEVAQRWPANMLSRRLELIVRDGRVDARERKHLKAILDQFAENPSGMNFSLATDLPIDQPEPAVVFEGRTFVFAGDMAYGPHRACEREVVELGGACERSVTRRTDYLVIGTMAAGDWSQEGFGAQVNDVGQLRARGAAIAIVSEEHWVAALP